MRVIKERANAKINLYLDVTAKRDDGFHDIKSVMHSVSLFDELTVLYSPSQQTNVRLSAANTRFLPTDDKNIAVKAANLFLKKAQITADVEIRLNKRIPIAAGLAGGSSDAAATLRAMNKLSGKIFSNRALYEMAAELGSDVPYCLLGKTALCEGRGEIITRLSDSLKLNAVIAIAEEHVSTPAAYSKLDDMYSSFKEGAVSNSEIYYKELTEWISGGKKPAHPLYNIFEAAVLPMCPGAEKIKKTLIELGAEYALMCGSGPSVLGIFPNEAMALSAGNKLKALNITAFAVKSV